MTCTHSQGKNPTWNPLLPLHQMDSSGGGMSITLIMSPTMSCGGAPSSSPHLGPSAPRHPRPSPQRDRMRAGASVYPEGASARPSSRQRGCGVLARPRRQQTQPGGEGAFNPSLRRRTPTFPTVHGERREGERGSSSGSRLHHMCLSALFV